MTFLEYLTAHAPGALAGLVLGLIPFVLAIRSKQWLLSFLTLILCVLGGLFGHLLAAIPAAIICSIALQARAKYNREQEDRADKIAATQAAKQALLESQAQQDGNASCKICILSNSAPGAAISALLYERLTREGYDVITDNPSLTPQVLEMDLAEPIHQSTDVLVVLSSGSLDNNEGTNFTLLEEELEIAFDERKTVIPVLLKGFAWPELLPRDINPLRYMNGIAANTKYINRCVERICSLLSYRQQTAESPSTEASNHV